MRLLFTCKLRFSDKQNWTYPHIKGNKLASFKKISYREGKLPNDIDVAVTERYLAIKIAVLTIYTNVFDVNILLHVTMFECFVWLPQ